MVLAVELAYWWRHPNLSIYPVAFSSFDHQEAPKIILNQKSKNFTLDKMISALTY
jgi:hypothetical protein